MMPKSWANPMVTTITISRGWSKKRHRMMKSTKRPRTAPDHERDEHADKPIEMFRTEV